MTFPTVTRPILALGLLVACTPAATHQDVAAAHSPPHGEHGIALADLDRSADPCTDFFAFSNGGWRAANPIPAGQPKWGRRLAVRDTNRRQLQGLLEDLARRTDLPPSSPEQLVGDTYASCMDEASVDAAGVQPLAPWLTEIDSAQTLADVQRAMRRMHEIALAAPFGVVGQMAYRTPASFVASIGPGANAFGLPDRDAYVSADPHAAEVRAKYRTHVAAVLELAGVANPEAAHQATAIVALETRLATASLPRAQADDPVATDHAMSFAQLQALAPHVEWAAYFGEASIARGELNVAEPAFVQAVDKELAETPVAAWKAYLAWRVLDTASPWLAKPFAQEAGAPDAKSRARRCVDLTEAELPHPLARVYAARYFPSATKAKARTIAVALMAQLQELAASATWMQPATKAKALDKLAATDIELGYPDRWMDTSAIAIHRASLWANIAAARRFATEDNRKAIGKPTARDLWQMVPTAPDAYIEPALIQLVLPEGFLQPFTFDPDATDAINYGSFGAALAHDLTHAVDVSGSETELSGAPVHWWTDADRAAFAARTRCVSDQADAFTIEPGVSLHGTQVLSEAVGDLGGLRIAYAALEKSLAARPASARGPGPDGFTPEQQFFIAWGQVRGDAMTIEAQRALVATDIHPVPKFRVNAPLANLPEFQRAFSCKDGAAMVRPAALRCTVW